MTLIKEDCKHERFQVNAKVTRLTEIEDGPVTGYSADIEIHCTECLRPFEFIGLPYGVCPSYPTTSVERTEARMPIKPV